MKYLWIIGMALAGFILASLAGAFLGWLIFGIEDGRSSAETVWQWAWILGGLIGGGYLGARIARR